MPTVFVSFGFPFFQNHFLKPQIVAQENLSLYAAGPIHYNYTPPEKCLGCELGEVTLAIYDGISILTHNLRICQ